MPGAAPGSSMGADALTRHLRARALALGFPRAEAARVEPLERDSAAFRAWLAEGLHGEMRYLERFEDVRADPRKKEVLADARSVLVLAAPYGGAGAEEDTAGVGPGPGRIARYARGRDYHNVLFKRVEKLARWLRGAGFEARTAVDRLPVLERAWAARAGLGFIGKNACLIVPGLGSHVLLALLFTSAELEPGTPVRDGCGGCTRCLDACPTRAFRSPHVLDARRCISYLTIEHPGLAEPALAAGVGPWFFGCDECQDVCPYNHGRAAALATPPAFAPDPRWRAVTARDLLQMPLAGVEALAAGTPLRRPGAAALVRNAAVVLGNSGDPANLGALEEAARAHPHPLVREAATAAARRLRG